MLNVFPWGRPALTELYRKMAGKAKTFSEITLNRDVILDLTWFKSIMPRAIGVTFAGDGRWQDCDADIVFYTDATLTSAIAFVYSNHGFTYQIQPPPVDVSKPDIFFFEELAVVSAMYHAASLPTPPHKVLIFCDNLDTVHAFNSLRVSHSVHNALLLAAAEIALTSGIGVRVRHIAGEHNIAADMLSRLMLDDFATLFPATRVRSFSPPRELMPARWRSCF